MSFWRHEEIYRSDVGLGKAGNANGCRRSPHSSAAMSFHSAIPRQVALQQSLPPLYRRETILNNQCCRTMILQRTATTPLTPCLSPRVHSNPYLSLLFSSLRTLAAFSDQTLSLKLHIRGQGSFDSVLAFVNESKNCAQDDRRLGVRGAESAVGFHSSSTHEPGTHEPRRQFRD